MEKKNSKRFKKSIAALLCAVITAAAVVFPEITAKADTLDDLWSIVETLPTQKETAIANPMAINPGEKAKVLKTYTFKKDMAVFSLPVNIGNNPQVFIKITLSGFSKSVAVRMGGYLTENRGNGESTMFTLYQKDGKEQKLTLIKDTADVEKDCKVEVAFYQYKKAASLKGTLPANRWAQGYNYNGSCLYKIKIPSDGIVKVESSADPNGNKDSVLGLSTALLNNKKKKISDAQMSGNGAQYCVKKGTYYLRASNSEGMVMIRYKFKKVKVSSKNTSKAKASGLKKGKTVKGFLPVGQSRNDSRWYKIVISKKSKMSVTVKCLAGEGQKMYLYQKGKSAPIAAGTKKLSYMGKNEKYAFSERFPLEKGIYYLKVTKNSKNDSVYYSVKWK